MSNFIKMFLVFALAVAAANAAQAESFVFETSTARLKIGANGAAISLLEKQSGKEQLRPKGLPFAAVRKDGRSFPSSAVERKGVLFHISFGTSGISADYRISASAEYLVVELVEVQGNGIEEVRLVQLSTPLANAGSVLGVRWDDEFAVGLIGLSQRVNSNLSGQVISASVYPEVSMLGQRVVIIAAPTSQFLDVVQKVEHDFQLPAPTIGGKWAKRSMDARTSYLFTDLTEANAEETIRYARLGGFQYILIYAGTWSASLGSYPINPKNYPHGETGLKSVVDKCHAAGLKVGMHMLTSFVGKNDPLVHPKPDRGLLKDGQATLSTDISEIATELAVTSSSAFTGLRLQPTYSDYMVDDEIIHCGQISGVRFLRCERGFARTKPVPHMAGAIVQRLVERYGSYLADLRSPLAGTISDRISGVINRVGFDMVYFDGGEVNSADGPSWYWVGVQQVQIWERSKRDLLVQGSGITPWTWHVFSRGTCDDYSAVGAKQYLDYHKIAYAWRIYHNNFLPAELGWLGFLQDTADHSATTPDELEYYVVRMLALDSAISLETNLNALKANGRSEEMLRLLARYEKLRLSGAVPKAVREKLAQGEWHMTQHEEFNPIRYDVQRMDIPGKIILKNVFDEQPLKFRMQVAPELAAVGDRMNIPLLQSQPPIELLPPGPKDPMPGALIQRIGLSEAVQSSGSVLLVGSSDRKSGDALDLTRHRALAVQLEVDGPALASDESPILNVQLQTSDSTYRDYYIDLDFRGPKTVVLTEPGTSRMLPEFSPAYSNYPYKAAMYSFNYENVVALNLRWMRHAKNSGVRCRVGLVEALTEQSSALHDIEISAGSVRIEIPGKMEAGDYAEYWGEGPIRVFDRNGVQLRTVPANSAPALKTGESSWAVMASGPGSIKLTAITLGK